MLALVTGGFGFLGSYVCEALSLAGWEFMVIDSLTYAAVNECFVIRLPGYRPESSGDVADPATWQWFDKPHWRPDAVFHLAAETHVDRSLGLDPTTLTPLREDPVERLYRTNVIGTVRAAEFARKVGARLIHWSTDEVYGDLTNDLGHRPTGIKMIREGCNPDDVIRRRDEDDALCPSSPYSASKAAAEMAVHASVRLGLHATILRPSNAYGPRQARDKLIPVAVRKLARGEPVPLYDGGYQVRQWVHAEDIARAALLAVDKKVDGAFNLGGPSLLRNTGLVQALAIGGRTSWSVVSVPDRPGHDVAYAVRSCRAERTLGWVPSRRIEEDAAELFAAYSKPA